MTDSENTPSLSRDHDKACSFVERKITLPSKPACLRGRLAWMFLFATAPAFAQTATAPAAQSTMSMWSVIWSGLGGPGYLVILGSILIVALIVEHFLTVRESTIAPIDQVKRARDLIERRAFRECLDAMKRSSTFFARTMSAALQHARHGFDAMHEAAVEKSGELSGRLYRKVEYLNIIGNLGPLLGLLGTVYGMILAFSDLGRGGGEAGADAGGLARGISLALVNTLLGLGLAIVGLLFFGICRNRIESLTVQGTVQALDLLEYFRPVTSGGAAPTSTTASSPERRPAGVESAG